MRLAKARFTALPATRLVRSGFPLVTIWRAARAGAQPRFAAVPEAEWALVTRPDLDVGVVALDAATGALFGDLMSGEALGVAAESALACDPHFDAGAALSLVVSGGAFASVALPQGE